MKRTKVMVAMLLFLATLGACKKDRVEEPELPEPNMENIELGLGDAGIGVIERDFHFNADVVAGDKISKVEIKISQKDDKTYSKPWAHEIVWDQYKGLKNTNIHKHFNIPADAAEGKYDFKVTVYDENGSKLEVRRDFEIYAAANLPVRPVITQLNLRKNGKPIYDWHGMAENPTEKYLKGDTLTSQVSLSYVKGDGIVYLLLVKKSSNYLPTTIEEIDLDKAIVYDVFEHKNMNSVDNFSNFVFDMETFTTVRRIPVFKIGAEQDNNVPIPNPISGAKGWQAVEYNLVVIYKNTTYNKTVYKSIPFGIDYN